MVLRPTVNDLEPKLQIRRLAENSGIGASIKGQVRTLEVTFPDKHDGTVVKITDSTGSKLIDLTIEPTTIKPETVPEQTLWEKLKGIFN